MANIIDIAREAGVSPSLVSYVLNKSTPIKKESHRRIIEIARRLNYVPNSTAKTMVTGRTNNILFVIQRSFLGTLHETFFQELLLYLTTLLSNRNIGLMLYASEENNTGELRKAILSRRADGIIWYLSEIPDDIKEMLVGLAYPTVLMLCRDDRLSYVKYDDYRAERELLEGVYDAGHRRIAFFGMTGTERHRAYTDLLREHGLEYRRDIYNTGSVFDSGNDYIAARDILRAEFAKAPLDFTCIAAEKDLTAINILNALGDMGIKVPDEVSVTGYDNINEASKPRYMLTTVSQDYGRLCDETVDTLMELIEHPGAGQTAKILTGEVIMRSTLKKLN